MISSCRRVAFLATGFFFDDFFFAVNLPFVTSFFGAPFLAVFLAEAVFLAADFFRVGFFLPTVFFLRADFFQAIGKFYQMFLSICSNRQRLVF